MRSTQKTWIPEGYFPINNAIKEEMQSPAPSPSQSNSTTNTTTSSISPSSSSSANKDNEEKTPLSETKHDGAVNIPPTRYLPIDSYGLIGNMKTAALVGVDGSIDWLCLPYFNSPSVFGRILDCKKGGYFQINSASPKTVTKQHYWPDTNILVTRFMSSDGVAQLVDFMPVVKTSQEEYLFTQEHKATWKQNEHYEKKQKNQTKSLFPGASTSQHHKPSYHWIARRLEVVHGAVCFKLDCFPAFNYARDDHTLELEEFGRRAIFRSPNLNLVLESNDVAFQEVKCPFTGRKGITQTFCLEENCSVSFVLRMQKDEPTVQTKYPVPAMNPESESHLATQSSMEDQTQKQSLDNISTCSSRKNSITDQISEETVSEKVTDDEEEDDELYQVSGVEPSSFDHSTRVKTDWEMPSAQYYREELLDINQLDEKVDWLFMLTLKYWHSWLSQCNYEGRYREDVRRSALVLKLMTFEKTGAIVAAPTCSLPESIGGNRNWDYRFTWIRDASFTLYAFMRIGFTQEAEQFMHFLEARCKEMDRHQRKSKLKNRPPLQVIYGIDGEHTLTEVTLDHLEGYKGSKPVRIGNGAHDQLQLDTYGELMDAVYLYNKYGNPISYDLWKYLRKIIDWVCDNWMFPDEGIWEVRGGKKHFLYSKVMCWVCIDRGIRLAEKRSFPSSKDRWTKVRDTIYEEIMKKGYNREIGAFTQYYNSSLLDASALILPLVFFVSPSDPRMLKTLDAINKSPKHGGLVSSSLVYRYDYSKTEDGFQETDEGTFNLCTFWLIEALTRAGKKDSKKLMEAQLLFEQMLSYSNHLKLYSEEMSFSGVALG